jgi:hypothetical protein
MKNYKVIAAVLVMGIITAGTVFAQESYGGKKNFVSADLGLLVAGARYERVLTPKLSVGADFYWANSFIIFNELEAGAFVRYYLVKGLYGELGLGFHTHSGVEDYEYKYSGVTYSGSDLVLTSGFGISPALGYKFDPGKPGGFFLTPQVTVPITIGKKEVSGLLVGSTAELDSGVAVGFVLDLSLGFAF